MAQKLTDKERKKRQVAKDAEFLKKRKAIHAAAHASREKHFEDIMGNPRSKFNRLTEKQKGYLRAKYIDRKTSKKAIQENYEVSNDHSASTLSPKINNSPRVISALEELFDEEGVGMREVAKAIKRGLNAKKTRWTHKEGLKGTDFPDHSTQLKAAEIALDSTGNSGRAKSQGGPGGVGMVKVQVGTKTDDDLDDYEEAVEIVLTKKYKKKKSSSSYDEDRVIEGETVESQEVISQDE
jgi:hypothetical protein